MKKSMFPIFLFAGLMLAGCQKNDVAPAGDETLDNRANCQNKITIPAGSVDALQQAIDDVCVGGTITLAAGVHTENAGVVVNKRVTIKGEEGAVLKVNTAAEYAYPFNLEAAIAVSNAQNARIENLEIRPLQSDPGGTAIILLHSKNAVVKNCSIYDHQFGVIVERSDNAQIVDNYVSTAAEIWQNFGLDAHGITVVNGKGVKVTGNEVANSFFGVWLCDKKGTYSHNETYGNAIGMILCKVPADDFLFFNGNEVAADFSGTEWTVTNNNSHDNFSLGYLVVDGSNGNHLVNNAAGNNADWDIELVGNSCRFGFFTPAAFDNKVVAGSHHQLSIKDCAENSTILGFTYVETGNCDAPDCP